MTNMFNHLQLLELQRVKKVRQSTNMENNLSRSMVVNGQSILLTAVIIRENRQVTVMNLDSALWQWHILNVVMQYLNGKNNISCLLYLLYITRICSFMIFIYLHFWKKNIKEETFFISHNYPKIREDFELSWCFAHVSIVAKKIRYAHFC